MAEPSEFGQLLKAKREVSGLSQPQLARLARVSAGYIGGMESGLRGKRPARDVVLRIARAFGENPYELLRAAGRLQTGDDPKAKPQRPSFEQFVRGEALLRDDEKDMLIRLYRSYVDGTPIPTPRTQRQAR